MLKPQMDADEPRVQAPGRITGFIRPIPSLIIRLSVSIWVDPWFFFSPIRDYA